MAADIRVKTKTRDNITTVRLIIRHPMETGFRVETENSELVPAHYINLVQVRHNGQLVLSCDWSRAVSKNPYLSFKFRNAAVGDRLTVFWSDNKNKTNTFETTIS